MREERLPERSDDDEVDPHDEVSHAVAILGSSSRKGRWTPPGTLRAFSLLGSVNLDFREADLLDETDVDVFALLGSVNIIVPPSVDVDVSGIGFLGDFAGASNNARDLDAPLI